MCASLSWGPPESLRQHCRAPVRRPRGGILGLRALWRHDRGGDIGETEARPRQSCHGDLPRHRVPTLAGGGHTTVSRRRFGSKAERRMRPVSDGCRFGASRTTYSGVRFPATGAGDCLQARAAKGIIYGSRQQGQRPVPLRLADRRRGARGGERRADFGHSGGDELLGGWYRATHRSDVVDGRGLAQPFQQQTVDLFRLADAPKQDKQYQNLGVTPQSCRRPWDRAGRY